MKRRALTLAALGFLLALTAASSAAQSLGDVARAAKEKREKEGKKPAKVYGNDDVLEMKAKAHKPGAALTVESPDGRSVQVTPDKGTTLIFMATWCPVSKAFKNILNDSRTRPYVAKQKLVFLFNNNEWPTIEGKLIKSAKKDNYSQNDIATMLAQMKHKSGSPHVYDPTFLSNLPGQFYFCTIPEEVEGFPQVVSLQGYIDRLEWLVQERDMPEELAAKVFDDHEHHEPSSSEQ